MNIDPDNILDANLNRILNSISETDLDDILNVDLKYFVLDVISNIDLDTIF